jgi:F0F1-type ATP synthase assembly protein I
MSSPQKPKLRKIIDAADGLSLGISIVVAVLMGVGLGILMRRYFGYNWLFWLGVFWGVAAALLNVFRAYRAQKASLDELKDDPRFKRRTFEDDEDDEW